MSHKKGKGGSNKKKAPTQSKPKRTNSKPAKDTSKSAPQLLSPQDRVAFVKPFWESLGINERIQLLTIDVDEVVSRISQTQSSPSDLSLEALYQRGCTRLDSDGSWKTWQWDKDSPVFLDAESFRKEGLEKTIPTELLSLLPREDGKPLEKPAEAALRERMTTLINNIQTQLQSAQEVWRRGQRGETGECTRDANIDLVITILDTLQHEHHCLYQMILTPVAEFVCNLVPNQTRKSTKTELFFEDLEKLNPEDVARLYEWLTEKVDGLCSRLKPDPKEEDPEEEAVGDIDLFSLTKDRTAFSVNPKWMEHLQDRKLSEEGQPRKVQEGEDPHKVGLVLEWVFGSIVSTAEKARDGAKRVLGDWKPSVHQSYENLLQALMDQSEWTQRSKNARELLHELISIRKQMSTLTTTHGVSLQDTKSKEANEATLPEPLIEGILNRESLLTNAKLHILQYDQLMAGNQLRSLRTELSQVEPEFERLKKELESRSNSRQNEKDKLRSKMSDALLEDQLEVQSAFREQGARLQGLYDKKQRTENEFSRREQEISQLENWKKNVNQLLKKFQSPANPASLLEARKAFHRDFLEQLYSDLDDQTFFSRIKSELKQVEKRVEDGAVVLQHLEMFLINIACDDPGALIGTSVILPLLQERLDEKAMEYSMQRASEAMNDLLQMEEERKLCLAKKEAKKKSKAPSVIESDQVSTSTGEDIPSEVSEKPIKEDRKVMDVKDKTPGPKEVQIEQNEDAVFAESEFQSVSNRRRSDRKRIQRGKQGTRDGVASQKPSVITVEKTPLQRQSSMDPANKKTKSTVLLASRSSPRRLATDEKTEPVLVKKQNFDWSKDHSLKRVQSVPEPPSKTTVEPIKTSDDKAPKQSTPIPVHTSVAWIKGSIPASVTNKAPQNAEELIENSNTSTGSSRSESSVHSPSTPDALDEGQHNFPSGTSDQTSKKQSMTQETKSESNDSSCCLQTEQISQDEEVGVQQEGSDASSEVSSVHSSDPETPEPEHLMIGPPLMPPPMGLPPPIGPAFHPNYYTQMQSVMNAPLPPPPPGYHPGMTPLDEDSNEEGESSSRPHSTLPAFPYYHPLPMPGYPMMMPYGQWYPPGVPLFGSPTHGLQAKAFPLRPTAEEFVPPSLKQEDQIGTIEEHKDEEDGSEDHVLTSNDEEEASFDQDCSATILPEVKESPMSMTPIIKQTC